jgi:hypothetical protein
MSERKKEAEKQAFLQLAKDEKEFVPSKKSVASVDEDSTDVGHLSDQDSLDAIDYDNAHLAFDPEKSPKFH